jgi:hypothetical protein
MADVDRSELLRMLDDRYDNLARELDQLNERIELALATHGVAASASAGVSAAGPNARSC